MVVARQSPKRRVIDVLEVGTIPVTSDSFTLGNISFMSLAFNNMLSGFEATPIILIQRKNLNEDINSLKMVIDRRNVGGIVIGYPLNMDGTEGRMCQSIRQFASNIDKSFNLPILFWDERMSTIAVNKQLISLDISRNKRKKIVDKEAATLILQGAIDHLNQLI